MTSKILIIGASGQIGSELTYRLRSEYGTENVIASDINTSNQEVVNSGVFETLDAKSYQAVNDCVKKYNIDTVYLLAAMLSATSEKYPEAAWELNMQSLFNVLNIAKEGTVKKVFWPSSIAVFGPSTPKNKTPQTTVMEPSTVYGISKQAGERWCEYYFNKYNVDVRSLRYPGIISWKTEPGGGTTDYAVSIFHKAITEGSYTSFLEENTALPMMYMEDAIEATLSLMKADKNQIKIRSSYNVGALSFTPKILAKAIQKKLPAFKMKYEIDFRQEIANSWPSQIDDSKAKVDWGWKHRFELDDIVEDMLHNLKQQYQTN